MDSFLSMLPGSMAQTRIRKKGNSLPPGSADLGVASIPGRLGGTRTEPAPMAGLFDLEKAFRAVAPARDFS